MKYPISIFLALFLAFLALPAFADHDELEVSGWLPYWRSEESIDSARAHLDEITTLHPFVYTVKQDGSIADLGNTDSRDWQNFYKSARRDDVLIVPTIMSGDGALIHSILSNDDRREEHIEAIVELVEDGDFDGIDIDYEAKMSATRPHFSEFLEELKDELGRKMILSCTVQSRTPLDSLYRNPPSSVNYADDYDVIADVCDIVNIMAYDQQRADVKLNDARKGTPYVPVADADWVRKVIKETLKTIPAEKIMLGVATYGYEYEVGVLPQQYATYGRVRALNIPNALARSEVSGIKPERNSAGELSFTYAPLLAHAPQFRMMPILQPGTTIANLIGAWTLSYANQTNLPAVFNYVTWSDAEAIRQKMELAQEFDLRGVALFKIDGDEDPAIWEMFED